MLTTWRYVQTAAWPQPEPQPEPQPDRSSLYINNGDVMQTAAIWLGRLESDFYSLHAWTRVLHISQYKFN